MSEVIPFDNLAGVGLLKDVPDLTLPPNGFSDVVNVRFRNNGIHKIKGETDLGEFGNGTEEIIFVTFWNNPNLAPDNGYYVYVSTDGVNDTVYMRSVDGVTVNELYSETTGGTWQSTLFQGGYILILNNGKDVPKYILDEDGNTNISALQAYDLVGWNDDYSILEEVINQTYNADTSSRDFYLGRNLNFLHNKVIAYILDKAGDIVATSELDSLGTEGEFTLSFDTATNSHILTASTELENGYKIIIYLQSVGNVVLTAGVIRAYGDLLIAGNLRETSVATGETIRRLTGAIRTSDVAPPGSVPTNWNPFAAGVSTADEIILSSTGIVQDIVELQGRAYIYTNHSIHSLSPTNNAEVPFSVSLVSAAYGAHSMDSVIEVDGQHIVVGSNDIYTFSGHPGNIKSIADNKVRYYFYDSLNSTYSSSLRVIRYLRYNELWFCFPNQDSTGALNEVLVYNYRTGIWTRRVLSEFKGITMGLAEIDSTIDANHYYPIIASEDDIIAGDSSYTDKNGAAYESYIQRTNMEMRPVFDTESVSAMSLYIQSDSALTMDVKVNQKDNPSTATDFSGDTIYNFVSNDGTNSDYKTDVRVSGRFIGFNISDGGDSSVGWTLSGLSVQTAKAGRR
jgi:hypothetical protein